MVSVGKAWCGGLCLAVLTATGCKTETQLAACGGVGVAGLGAWGSFTISQATAYDPYLRDADGRLVPIAQQNDKNLVPVAIAVGGIALLVSGSLFAFSLSETYDDAKKEAARAAPPPNLSGERPGREPPSTKNHDDGAREDEGSMGDPPPPP